MPATFSLPRSLIRAARAFGARVPAADVFARVRSGLRAIGYRETSIAAALRLPDLAALLPGRRSLYRARLEDADVSEALIAAARILLLGDTLKRAEVVAACVDEAPALLSALEAAGLVVAVPKPGAARGATHLAAPALVYPCGGVWVTTDRRDLPPGRLEPVMYLGGDSYALAYLIPEVPGGRVLDLCTGSGIQAITALARGAASAVAVDVSERALRFTRWNAALNDVADRLATRIGDLYEALTPDDASAFSLLLANPPFVPSPHRGRKRIGFRDGGRTGDEVLRRILGGAAARLSADGLALCVSVYVETEQETLGARILDALGPAADLRAVLLAFGDQGPVDYAFQQTGRVGAGGERERDARFDAWRRALVREGIGSLVGGVLALFRAEGPVPPRVRRVEASPPRSPAPKTIDAHRAVEAALTASAFPSEWLDRRVRPAAGLALASRFAPGGRADSLTAPPAASSVLVAARVTVDRSALGLQPISLSKTLAAFVEVTATADSLRAALAEFDVSVRPALLAETRGLVSQSILRVGS